MSIKLDSLSRRLSILEVRFDERLDVPPTQDQPRRTDGASSSRVEPEVYSPSSGSRSPSSSMSARSAP